MAKVSPDVGRTSTTAPIYTRTHSPNYTQQGFTIPFSLNTQKLCLYLLTLCITLFVLTHIRDLQTQPSSHPTPSPSLSLTHLWQKILDAKRDTTLKAMAEKLRDAITFLPLKDLRFADRAREDHTWFMSSMNDTRIEGEAQYQQFPSTSSKGMVLCLKGRDSHDGSWNYYALAWPETLPRNATFMKGLTFVSYNHYSYDNIWHGLSSVFPFVSWLLKNSCRSPDRWILYQWGELKFKMAPWLNNLLEATFGKPLSIEVFDKIQEDNPVCFEEAIVMRHNEGGMSRHRRLEAYDLLRCKARQYCGMSLLKNQINKDDGQRENNHPVVGLTMFMRKGARSFKNNSAVTKIFQKVCDKVEGCHLRVAYSGELSFCEQVKLMSRTDILVSPHGAQLTNMFLMDRNSSVMEFYPKGWLKLAGVGQYVYRWLASWSGMKYEGAWRDPNGETCPYADDDRRCMSIYKSGKIGHNETYFTGWAKNVLNEVKAWKIEALIKPSSSNCACS